MSYEKLTDHVERSLARLAMQFRNSESHKGILSAFVEELQEVEDALYDVFVTSAIANATGHQLDGIGDILGEKREGRDDDAYRVAISARYLINKASGTVEEILHLFSIISSADRRLQEYFPAALILHLETEATTNPEILATVLHAIKAGGVRAILHYLTDDNANTFTLAADEDQPTIWGETTSTITGGISEWVNIAYESDADFPSSGKAIIVGPNGSETFFFAYDGLEVDRNPVNVFTYSYPIGSTIRLLYPDVSRGLCDANGSLLSGKLAGVIG